jgi:addiction module RelE/StbE family toxin
MIITWSAIARAELAAITDYIELASPQAALEFIPQIVSSVDILINHPEIGRSGRVNGTRELIVHKTYIVSYSVLDKNITILSVRHTSRLWPQKF